MEEAHAGADLAVPADEGRAIVDEPAPPRIDGDAIAHEGQVLEALKQVEEHVLGRVVDVDARQAELGLARGEGEGLQGQRLEAEHFFFHRLAVRQDVADHDPPGADRAGQPVEVLDVLEVRLHDDEGDADLDLMSVPAILPGQALDVFHDAAQAGSGPDRIEAFLGRPVEGDPERVQPLAQEAVDEGVVEQRGVGRHLGPQAQRLDGLDHVEDPRVGRRFAEAAEHDRLEVGKPRELTDEEAECLRVHIAHRLVPGVPDTGPAGQVAAGGRLDIEAVQAVDVGQDLRSPSVNDHLQAGARLETELLLEIRRKDELTFLNEQLINGLACSRLAPQQTLFAFLEIGHEPGAFGHVQGELVLVHRINI